MKFKVEIPGFDCLPKRLERLAEFSYNLWWSWHASGREIFRRLDHSVWRSCEHNPIKLLLTIDPEQVDAAAENPHFLALFDSIMRRYDEYMNSRVTWFSESHPQHRDSHIAYFCAEFGLHNSLPFYSGGLGMLAGDTCKEASDLGIPMVAMGALYPEGYFHQEIEPDGRQVAHYTRFEPDSAPILPVLNPDGSRLLVRVPLGNDEVWIAVWKVQIGRVPIFLMDTDIEENAVWLRDVAARLYGGDHQVRLRQEIILGMGGTRLLRELGFRPKVLHLNEGHAAFASIEMLREKLGAGLSFEDALEQVRSTVVFTTHTPVQAGHDEFSFDQIEEYFTRTWELLGVSRERFLALGQFEDRPSFSMTVLALRTAGRSNGVSKKHGEISRQMWCKVWGVEPDEAPIQSITNGVHVPTWIANELVDHYQKFVGPYWWARHDDLDLWERILLIPDQDLWDTHVKLKTKLLDFVREEARRRWQKRVSSADHLVALGALLSPGALTIGFARRFATYKRSTLLFKDLERLRRILRNPRRPVQIIFSGKAHPADEPGKYLLQQVFKACSSADLAGHVAFIEDYDKHVAHYLVSGVDVWLNTPTAPLEASGTSGQKASLNGIPNLSVLDGWWFEGYNKQNGWAIEGDGDDATANSIYNLLEYEIAPRFYDRDAQGIPKDWIGLMKETIRSIAAPFSARRMLKEYVEKLYFLGENGTRD